MATAFSDVWADFWAWMESHSAGAYLFRGQADASPIIPKIGRPSFNYDRARERDLFNAFKRAARPFVGLLASDWEWLALAQHHGAPTRLADWSTSPLVAAWFAVTSFPEGTDAMVFALGLARADLEILDIATGETASGSSVREPLAITKGVYLIETPPVSARITTQRGIFTLHGSPTTPIAVSTAETFVIPKDMRHNFQGRLLDLGIDASHIYPDLDGLCKTLDWRLKSGKGFSSIG